MARRHRWRPDLELPPSVRWLPAGRWRWHNGQMAGAIVAAFGRPNEGQLSGVQLIHVDAEGRRRSADSAVVVPCGVVGRVDVDAGGT